MLKQMPPLGLQTYDSRRPKRALRVAQAAIVKIFVARKEDRGSRLVLIFLDAPVEDLNPADAYIRP
jgi:hypothetical protein